MFDVGNCPAHIKHICYDISVPFHNHLNDFIYLFHRVGQHSGTFYDCVVSELENRLCKHFMWVFSILCEKGFFHNIEIDLNKGGNSSLTIVHSIFDLVRIEARGCGDEIFT